MNGSESIWTSDDLPELKTGDCVCFKPRDKIRQWFAEKIGAVSWHWALVGRKQPADDWGGVDWSVAESIPQKGVARTLLSQNQYLNYHMRVYRPKLPDGEQDKLAPYIMKRCNFYGGARFDWAGATNIGLWFLVRHLGIKWWMKKDMRFWCLELCNQVWADLDFPLCDMGEPPNPANFEQSDQLELIWGTF
jgi:hypothetical protein